MSLQKSVSELRQTIPVWITTAAKCFVAHDIASPDTYDKFIDYAKAVYILKETRQDPGTPNCAINHVKAEKSLITCIAARNVHKTRRVGWRSSRTYSGNEIHARE